MKPLVKLTFGFRLADQENNSLIHSKQTTLHGYVTLCSDGAPLCPHLYHHISESSEGNPRGSGPVFFEWMGPFLI